MNETLKGFLKVTLYIAAVPAGIALAIICMYLWMPLVIPSDFIPYTNEISDDPNDYRIINNYLEEVLRYEENTDFLPDRIEVRDDTIYSYRFVYDDPIMRYTLYLEQSYDDEPSFEAEIARIKSFPHKGELDCGDIEYIIFSMPGEREIRGYINYDKSILTRRFNFKCYAAKIDNQNNRVTYLLTYEYDNTRQKGVVIEFLKAYLADTNT